MREREQVEVEGDWVAEGCLDSAVGLGFVVGSGFEADWDFGAGSDPEADLGSVADWGSADFADHLVFQYPEG